MIRDDFSFLSNRIEGFHLAGSSWVGLQTVTIWCDQQSILPIETTASTTLPKMVSFTGDSFVNFREHFSAPIL